MNWGIKLALKKLKNQRNQNSIFEILAGIGLFSAKIWKIEKLGNEIKPKAFNTYIFVKKIK